MYLTTVIFWKIFLSMKSTKRSLLEINMKINKNLWSLIIIIKRNLWQIMHLIPPPKKLFNSILNIIIFPHLKKKSEMQKNFKLLRIF